MTTLAPASASASTQASPIACPPPVTTAIRPSRRSFSRYMVDPSCQLLLMLGRRTSRRASAAQRNPRVVEAVDPIGLGRQPHGVAGLDAVLAGRARGDAAEILHVDIKEGVGAEMFGDADGAAPFAGVARDVDVLRPNPDGRRAAGLGLDQIHPRRANKARDEEVCRVVVELERGSDLLDPPGI